MRIALIVDHPLRDLPGLALIAKDLAEKNCEVFLVPMYNQERECLALAPDFVLLNYLRKNNEQFVNRLRNAGIQFGINDTEGGFYGDLDYYGSVLSNDQDLNESINCNLIWGQKMFDYLKSKPRWNHNLKITGLPRFDFYSEKFKNLSFSHLMNVDVKNMFLINTKVAVANPLFVTVEKEIDIYKNKLGISEEKIEHYLKFGRLSIQDNLNLANTISDYFPNSSVVIRPHPHENDKTYRDQIPADKNRIFVYREGPVIPWILSSKAVLHRHCTTAIEAAIANIPAISPTWVNTSANAPDAERVSHIANSADQLFELLAAAQNNTLAQTTEIKNNVLSIIDDWLFQVDGDAHVRVANEILNTLKPTSVKTSVSRNELYNIFDHRSDLKGQLFTQFSQISKAYPKPLWLIEKLRLSKWKKTQKYFTPSDVKNWIQPIAQHQGQNNLQIDWAKNEDCYLDQYPGDSVRVVSKT